VAVRHTYFIASLGRAFGDDADALGPALVATWAALRIAPAVTRYEGASTWLEGGRRVTRVCRARSDDPCDLDVLDVEISSAV
jgi:hypothetical protein